MTGREAAYIEDIQRDAEELALIMNEIGPLFLQAGEDPALILNSGLQPEVAGPLVQWQAVSRDMTNYHLSARQQHIHDTWMELSPLHPGAIGDIILSPGTFDIEALMRGAARMNDGILLVGEVTRAATASQLDLNAFFEPTHAMSPVAGCDAYRNGDEVQLYYAAYSEEQPIINPDFDGVAC